MARQTDSYGLIIVKLKRKLQYRGHVLFELVRPSVILGVPEYLKASNNLHSDVAIEQQYIPETLFLAEPVIRPDATAENNIDLEADENPITQIQDNFK